MSLVQHLYNASRWGCGFTTSPSRCLFRQPLNVIEGALTVNCTVFLCTLRQLDHNLIPGGSQAVKSRGMSRILEVNSEFLARRLGQETKTIAWIKIHPDCGDSNESISENAVSAVII